MMEFHLMEIPIMITGNRSRARIRQRQDEALERKKVYEGRTFEQQLKLIKTRPGESKKEKHRLVELIEISNKKSK